jgi:ABC-type branched-subunit amino acid transport system ATPase component/ABC-type branched-subunit amino acid transport system permease subunit
VVNYLTQISIFISVYLLLATSQNLVLGFGGLFSIVQAALYGVGAYAAALLVLRLHAPFPLDLIGAFVIACAVGAVLAGMMSRLKAELVIIATLALQLIFSTVFRNWNAVTGGNYGTYGIPRPSLFGMPLTGLAQFALYAAVVALLAFAASLLVARSPFGLAVRGQREDPVLAEALGHNAGRERTLIFVLAAGIAGIAGAVYGQFVGYVDPSSFDVNQSLSIITIVVVGGLGNLWGTLGAAIILTFLPQLLLLIPSTSNAAAQLQLLLYGLILVTIVRFWPNGLIPERPSVRAPRRAAPAPTATTEGDAARTLDRLEAVTVEPLAVPAPAVRLEGLAKAFGGLRAVDNVSLTLEPGVVTALIGPNGAGKTTLFNLVCGLLRPDQGRVYFGGRETTNAPQYDVARIGVTRTFQDVRIFPKLTALENIVFALSTAAFAPPGNLRERAFATLADLQLDGHADMPAGSLSYAQQKMLMIGIVLARHDPVVFLDEIAAGLDHTSVHAFARLVRRLAASGRTVCLVEHNLGFVWEAADTVIVLDAGAVVTSGPPSAIQADPRVVEIYFGQGTTVVRP